MIQELAGRMCEGICVINVDQGYAYDYYTWAKTRMKLENHKVELCAKW